MSSIDRKTLAMAEALDESGIDLDCVDSVARVLVEGPFAPHEASVLADAATLAAKHLRARVGAPFE